MRVLLLANPASGSGRGRRRAEVAAAALCAIGASVETLLTSGPGDARRRLEAGRAAGFERVVACGGDGLVSEVVAALAGPGPQSSLPPLAIVPAGRGNDLARSLRVPLDVREAARLAATGPVVCRDLGEANGRIFCTVAACGLDAEVSRRARTSRLPLPGAGTYIVELLKALRTFPGTRARLEHDGGVLEEEVLLVAVANTPFYGGGFLVAPGADTADGLLDACVIRARSRLSQLALFPSVMRGGHLAREGVSVIRSARFTLTCEPPLPVEADGEPLAATPVSYRCRPGALRVVAGNA